MAAMSVGEILRAISAVTNRDVPADVLNKPEKMDEIMWQLLMLYFDSPNIQFSPALMLKLIHIAMEELQFPQAFSITDLGETRNRKKWMDAFSWLLDFLQFKAQFKAVDEIYTDVVNRKTEYSEMCKLISKQEEEFSNRQTEIQSKQEAIKQLTTQVEDTKSQYKKLDARLNSLKGQLSDVQDELSRRLENTETLKTQNAELESEYEKSTNDILENVDSLAKGIPIIKSQMDEVETEMHALFEKRTRLFERTTEFHHYEALLDHLKLDDIYEVLNNCAALKHRGKALQKQLEGAVSELEAERAERDSLLQSLSDAQNEIMRKKLLLAKKRKAVQANKKCGAKDLAAIEREAAELQEAGNKVQRTLTLTEEQIKLGHLENDKLNKQLAQSDKLAGQLAEIHKKLMTLR